MSKKRVLFSVLVAASLVACGSTKKVGKDNVAVPTPLVEFAETAKFERLWRTSLNGGDRKRGERLRPSISGATVFVAGKDEVRALAVQTGASVWTAKRAGSWSAGPSSDGKRVAVGSIEGELAIFDASDGEHLWSVNVSSEVLAAPAISSSVVVAKTIDGRIHAFSVSDGKPLWQVARDVPLLTLRGSSAPIVDGELVFVASENGRVAALQLKDGLPLWEQTVSLSSGRNELERVNDIDGEIAFANGDLFVAGYNGQTAAVASNNGQSFWSVNAPSVTGLALADKAVYVSGSDSEVIALDRRSGGELWRQAALKHRLISAPVLLGNWVVVADVEGFLHALSADDGQLQARVQINESPITMAPVVAGSTIVTQSDNGSLNAFELR